jgi:methyl-accepting chemotaxis protein
LNSLDRTTRSTKGKGNSRGDLDGAASAGTVGEGFLQMTIGKKLYVGFGSILSILVVLFLVNIFAGLKARSASNDANVALQSMRTIESVRYQIMLNRNNLNNFLLSGDPRDEDKVNHGLSDIIDMIKRGESQAGNDLLRTALIQVESTEASWGDNFAKPLLAKRHQVDSGDATVSDLQIFYLQKDPASWLTKSSAVLDQTASQITKSQIETSNSAESASKASLWMTLGGTLIAVLVGLCVAYFTAKSISEPLTHLITVAREIGDSGDLDQNIDIHRNDEIGALATTFNNMVAYLKEMAGV